MTVAVQAAPAPGAAASESPVRVEGVRPLQPVPKPDDAHFDALIKEETDAMEALRGRLTDLNDQLTKLGGGFEEYQRQRDAQRAKIDEISKRIDALVQERDQITQRSQRAQESSRSLRSQIDLMQRNLGFHTVEDIDKRIAEITHEMMVNTMTLREEKKLIADIEKLRKAKPELAKIAELQDRAQYAETTGASGYRDRLTEIRTELNQLRDARADESEKMRDLVAEREKQLAPLRDIREERDELRRKIGAHQSAITQLQSTRRAKETEYRAYQARLRAAQADVDRWERQRAQLEADKRLVQQDLANLQDGVYDWKSLLALQVISYLKEQQERYEAALKAPADEEEDAGQGGEEIETEDGGKYKVYVPKKVETFSVGGGSAKRGKKKAAKPRDPKSVSDKLQHTLSTIKDFSQLGFDTDYPLTMGDVPKALSKLEAIVEEQRVKNMSQEEVNKLKRKQLEDKLKVLEERETTLMAAMPEEAKRGQRRRAAAAAAADSN